MSKNQDRSWGEGNICLPGAAEDLEPIVHGSTDLHAEMYVQ